MSEITPEEVVSAMSEVRGPEIEASDYSFLEEIEKAHPAPSKKANDGLANWIADLAIFRINGSMVVDEGLIEEADKILAEQNGGKSSRIRHIVSDSENRPGGKKSLLENKVNGHERLLEFAEDFYAETGREQELENLYKDKGLLLDCGNMTGGNIFGIDPATGLKVAVDALDEYMSDDEASDYTVIPVHEEDDSSFSSKPENLDELQGGENEMGLADDLDTLDLAQEDHYNAAERMDNALEEYGNTAEAAEAVAEELATVYDLQGQAAESVVGSMTDYLMDHRAHMDDTALELLEGAEDVRETLDDIDVPNYDDVMDAVHVAARIERKTEEDYDFNF